MMSSALANSIDGVRVWPSPDSTRVVLDMSATPQYSYFTLENPHRLVIDLKGTVNKANFDAVKHRGPLIVKLRKSTPQSPNTYRLVIELNKATTPSIFPLAPAGPYGHRLVVDLSHDGKDALAAAMPAAPVAKPATPIAVATPVAKPAQPIAEANKPTPVAKPAQPLNVTTQITPQPTPAPSSNQPAEATSFRDVVIAIDAGHGGDFLVPEFSFLDQLEVKGENREIAAPGAPRRMVGRDIFFG